MSYQLLQILQPTDNASSSSVQSPLHVIADRLLYRLTNLASQVAEENQFESVEIQQGSMNRYARITLVAGLSISSLTTQLFSATVACLTSMSRSKLLLTEQLSVIRALLQEFAYQHKGHEDRLSQEVCQFYRSHF